MFPFCGGIPPLLRLVSVGLERWRADWYRLDDTVTIHDALDFGCGFWKENRLQSGKRIDVLRGQNIPQNARAIDRTIGLDTVISHKSTDLRLPSYRSSRCVYRLGMRFVRALAAYQGEVRRDHRRKATYYLTWAVEGGGPRILEWFIPEVGVSPEQEEAVSQVMCDAANLGVTVKLFRVKD